MSGSVSGTLIVSALAPAGTAWTSDADFDAITACFEPPAADEAFTVIHHPRE
jgi:hypothetical protein